MPPPRTHAAQKKEHFCIETQKHPPSKRLLISGRSQMEKKPAGKASPGAGQKRKADAKEEEEQEGVVKSPFFGGKAKSDSGSQEKAGKRKATRHDALSQRCESTQSFEITRALLHSV